MLDALPENAVLVTPPTNPTFILLYLTQVEGARPDVDVYVTVVRVIVSVRHVSRPR